MFAFVYIPRENSGTGCLGGLIPQGFLSLPQQQHGPQSERGARPEQLLTTLGAHRQPPAVPGSVVLSSRGQSGCRPTNLSSCSPLTCQSPRVRPFPQPAFCHFQAVLRANASPPGGHTTPLSTVPHAGPATCPWPPSQPCRCGHGCFPGLCLFSEWKHDGTKCWLRVRTKARQPHGQEPQASLTLGVDAPCPAGLGLCADSSLHKHRGRRALPTTDGGAGPGDD